MMKPNNKRMKKILSINKASKNTDIAILVLRVAFAALMLSHGLPKLQALVSGNIQFPSVMGMGPFLSLTLAVVAEFVAPLFILFGLGTRIAAVPVIITMLVAVFYIHGADPFSNKELALVYTIPFIGLLIAGSGRYSLDKVVVKETTSQKRTRTVEDPTLSMYHIN
jgi:putative oxidoreductase